MKAQRTHTEGQWYLTDEWTIKSGEKCIAKVYPSVGNFDGIPNANLLVSAPELLEALKDAEISLLQTDIPNTKPHFMTKIAIAIAKAEGH